METLRHFFQLVLSSNLNDLIRWGGYTALAVIVFAETGLLVGFFLPGDSLLVTAGILAGAGELNLLWLNLLLCAMAIAGDATGYYIGLKSGPRLFKRDDSLLFRKAHLLRTKAFYEKHGGKTIIIARFMPLVRTFAPVVAGVGQMPYARFASFNVVGGIGWVVSMTCTGYFIVKAIPNAEKYIHYIVFGVIFLSILPGIIAYARQRFAAKPSEQ
ncbi:MAG TPA: VTT domain-containing protein [Myxococcota bacterium]|jgi:membrane-associated protein|nr:VTT domain-containing protein [Myxococcota bacterium]